MNRPVLVALLAFALVTLTWAAIATRYKYYTLKVDSDTEVHRIDRWTGTPEVWSCRWVDTGRVADVLPPPVKPPEVSVEPLTNEAINARLKYIDELNRWAIEYNRWAMEHPNVNQENLHIMRTRCAWKLATE